MKKKTIAKEMEPIPLTAPICKPEKHEIGTCPGCGAIYDVSDEQHFSYPGLSVNWECPTCGMTGSEEYRMDFLAHGSLMRPKQL